MARTAHHSTPISKSDLSTALGHLHTAVREEMRIQTKDILEHVGKRFDNIDQELLQVNTKLDAIMNGEVLMTRK